MFTPLAGGAASPWPRLDLTHPFAREAEAPADRVTAWDDGRRGGGGLDVDECRCHSGYRRGTFAPIQVGGWICAAEVVLTARDLQEMSAAIQRTAAGSGPVLA